MAECQTEIVNG